MHACMPLVAQVYGPPPRPTAAALTDQLVDMGFERNAAAGAVRRFNNLDLAVAYLLQTPGASMANTSSNQPAGAGAAAAALAGSSAQPAQQQEQQRGTAQAGEDAAAVQAEQGAPGAAPEGELLCHTPAGSASAAQSLCFALKQSICQKHHTWVTHAACRMLHAMIALQQQHMP